jgi:2-polyprenyl-3-methyl-5-hydroxy-6-metoxy-1,4-benzoquinol methylase
MAVQNWQKEAKSFRGVKYGSPSLEWTSGLEHRLVLMKKMVDFKEKKVLDVGCGIGMFLEQFKNLGARVFGVDVDTEKINIAKKNFKTVYVSKAEKLPFQKNIFDLILLHEVIEHVDDDKQTIQECFRVLKKGGKLIIFAPNRLWPFETHGIFRHDKYHFGNIFLVTYLPNFLYKEMTPHVRNYFKHDLFALLNGLRYKKIIYRRIFPGFDKLSSKVPFIGKIIQKIFRILDRTPLNIFGISHFLIIEKS